MANKKPMIGDIVNAKTPAGLAHLQYTHDGRGMGALVRVLPGLYSSRPTDFAQLARQRELYFTSYTLQHAVRNSDAEIIPHQPVPEWAKPYPMMRHSADSDAKGKTLVWRIVRADTRFTFENLQRAPRHRELTPDLAMLSIRALWPHPSLLRKLTKGWTPERSEEFRLKAASEAKMREARGPSPRFPLIRACVITCTSPGRRMLRRLRNASPPQDDEEMEALAAELDGEHDGWEAAV